MCCRRTARASGAESATVYACGLVQGIVLVTFPAASMILTAPASYDLSSSQYGLLFVPQVSTAIAASLVGARLLWRRLTRHASEKTVVLVGLLADQASMVLLIASWLVVHQHAAAFTLLLGRRPAWERVSGSRCRRSIRWPQHSIRRR